MRSSALASFFRYDGRRTRLFNRAEADMMNGRGESVLGKKRRRGGSGGISIFFNPTGKVSTQWPTAPEEWKFLDLL
jgi:hypothetical protein